MGAGSREKQVDNHKDRHHHHDHHDDDDDDQNRKSAGADCRIIAHGAGSPGCRVKRWRQLAVTTSWGGGL